MNHFSLLLFCSHLSKDYRNNKVDSVPAKGQRLTAIPGPLEEPGNEKCREHSFVPGAIPRMNGDIFSRDLKEVFA